MLRRYFLVFYFYCVSIAASIPFKVKYSGPVLPVIDFPGRPSNEVEECLQIIEEASRVFGIPPHLLKAISYVESGYNFRGRFAPWPWTLNVDGVAKFFHNRYEAEIVLREAVRSGRQVDAGPLQISFNFHSKAFRDPGTLLNIRDNIYYAAQFLRNLFDQQHCWHKAIMAYHGNTREKQQVYLSKVKKHLPYDSDKLNAYVPLSRWVGSVRV